MSESQKQNELVMGRADVLLRFLQLIGKASPAAIDAYLEELDTDTEQRPLSEQLVDRIIAGDGALYEKYAQARKEVGSRNPYSSTDERVSPEYEKALGFFLARWIELEDRLRQSMPVISPIKSSHSASNPMRLISSSPVVPETLRKELDIIRRLRNDVVHGMRSPEPDLLMDAGNRIAGVIDEIEAAELARERVVEQSEVGSRAEDDTGALQ
jgi:hypothetical protein